jgi:hypothetical protein
MRLKFIPKPIEWDEVREEILKAIEEEERRNGTVVVTSTGESISIEKSQPQMDSKQTGKMSSAADSGSTIEGGTQ